MRYALFPMLLLLAAGMPAHAQAPVAPQSILVLDASGSMWGQIEGQPKIAIAREAVAAMLSEWSGGDLGLMAYGHRRKGDCEDIELLIEPGSGDAAAIRRQVDALNPKGMTPIAAAVRQAAEHLRFTEQKATVILVSDGEETCNADPCALGAELERLGIDFTAHVVGFDIERNVAAREQLQCLAASTGGRYLEARDAAELNSAIKQVGGAEALPEKDDLDETQWYMPCVDLYESDYANFDMGPQDTARTCQTLCANDERCDAYTFTQPGWQAEHGKCWLKEGAPWQRNCDECTSGAKPGVKVHVDGEFVDPSDRPDCRVEQTRE